MSTTPHSSSSGLAGWLPRKLWLFAALVAVFVFATAAHAQSSNAIFNGPSNMDQGLQSGMNNVTGYVYAILKFLSIIALGVAYYFVTHSGVGKAILATIAAVLLWFAPVVSNIAQSLGGAAAQQSQFTSPG